MRAFSKFSFTVGTVSFDAFRKTVDAYLVAKGLGYEKLGYFISDIDCTKETRIRIAKDCRAIPNSKSATVLDMHDLIQAYPCFGEIKTMALASNAFVQVLTNLDEHGNVMEAGAEDPDIRAVVQQFPLPYYISDMILSYSNVCFFNRNTEPVLESCLPYIHSILERKGNHITFYKSGIPSQSIKAVLMAEITDGETVLDAAPYAAELASAFGKKCTVETVIYQAPEEKRQYERLKLNAQPLVDAARESICARTTRYPAAPSNVLPDLQNSNFQTAKSLKRIGKAYGYVRYRYDPNKVYHISKPLPGGHLLTFSVDVPPHFNEMRITARLNGLGFSYHFPMTERYVPDQETADSILRASFEILDDMTDAFRAICDIYPDTPDWYEIRPV